MTLAEMRARLEAMQIERQALHTSAGAEAFTDEQQTRWDALDTEETQLRETMRPLEESEARAARVAESRARWGSTQVAPVNDPSDHGDLRFLSGTPLRDKAMAIVDSREGGSHLTDGQKTRMARMLRTQTGDMDGDMIGRLLLATENPHYRSAFQKISSSTSPILTQEEGRAVEQVRMIKRAMSIGTDSAGGFAVPVLIDPTIILTAQGSPNDILRLARVETITNDEWRGLTSAGVTWKFRAEAAASSDGSPTIAQPTVPTRRADGFIPFSIEIGMDWESFAEQMVTLLGEGYDELLAEKLTNGTNGSNEPDGLVAQLDAIPASEREVATAGTIAAGDVYGLWKSLPKRFRNKASTAWMSSTDIQNSIRQLGTTDPNFTVNLTADGIESMFSKEYPTNDFMQDDPTGTGTQPLLVVGDFKSYLVAQRAGMTVEYIPHLFDVTNNMPTGQRGYFAWARVGGKLIVPNGMRLLVNRSA